MKKCKHKNTIGRMDNKSAEIKCNDCGVILDFTPFVKKPLKKPI